jgi:hypothetical protein
MRLALATEDTFLTSVEEAINSNKKTQFSRGKKIQIRFLCSNGSETLPDEIASALSDTGIDDPVWARNHWDIEMTYGQAVRVRDRMMGNV